RDFRRPALSPEPDLRGRPFPGMDASQVHRMRGQNRFRSLHQLAQAVAARATRQISLDWLVRNVVRRLRLGLGREWGGSPPDDKIAIADARNELDCVTAERRLQGSDELPAFLAGNVPGREIDHFAVGDMDQIAADRPIVWP